ncbi:MAG: UvrB/UvrC motif-containing protein, partial [Candidatus Kerfeldbacteria bacterium]|nr:UvrB/UvrC motif-containing protein [Candidatus Kerfeldbacteria bacterium]
IQTMGRAARHEEGLAIMYADHITDSMRRAITETQRRRKIQDVYNHEHGITPKSIQKKIRDDRMSGAHAEEPVERMSAYRDLDTHARKRYLEELEQQMELAASNLEFEHAAALRDTIQALKDSTPAKQKRSRRRT